MPHSSFTSEWAPIYSVKLVAVTSAGWHAFSDCCSEANDKKVMCALCKQSSTMVSLSATKTTIELCMQPRYTHNGFCQVATHPNIFKPDHADSIEKFCTESIIRNSKGMSAQRQNTTNNLEAN